MLQLVTALIGGLGNAAIRNAWQKIGPIGFLLVGGLAFVGYRKVSAETRAKVGEGVSTGLAAFAEAYAEWQAHVRNFRRASPALPTWEIMAGTNAPADVLARACLFSLARVGANNCSAAELKTCLPELPVAQGEAKIRQILRATPGLFEAWNGRWQVGEMAIPLGQLLTLKVASSLRHRSKGVGEVVETRLDVGGAELHL
jgi:hypothetical protein